MTISDEIVKELVKFEAKTGQKPTCIYLGVNTRYKLMNETKLSNCVTFSVGNKLKFHSLPIYTVDEYEHLGVS